MSQGAGCLVTFAVAAVVCYLATFGVRAAAGRAHLVVMPDSARVHSIPTPTFGGAGMFVAFGVTVVIAWAVPAFRGDFASLSEPFGVLAGLAVIFVLGLADDLREVSAPAKVAGQVLAAMVLFFLGVTMSHFKVPFAGFVVLSPSVLPLVTAFWVIAICNAVNLIDGLDGLAAGVVAIASGALCVYGLRLEELRVLTGDNFGPLVAAATCGICIGFLPHNFHRAKIFMGDTGAMVLGLLMAVSTMLIGGQSYDYSGQTYFFFAPLLVPVFILGVPLLDTVFAIARRTARRSGLAARDLDHLHHRLMRLGHGHRRAVLVLWAWTAILSAVALYPSFDPRWNLAIPIGVAVLGAGLYTWFRPGRHSKLAPGAEVLIDIEDTEASMSTVGRPGDATAGATRRGAHRRGLDAGTAEHRAQMRRRFARHHRPTRG
ncbi:MAG: MraY family glycosyltransferase [Acidimicrobiales bacterium]